MKRIFRYELELLPRPENFLGIYMPKGAEILSCELGIDGKPQVWALIDEGEECAAEQQLIYAVWTGYEINEGAWKKKFLGTIIYAGLVYHIFLEG